MLLTLLDPFLGTEVALESHEHGVRSADTHVAHVHPHNLEAVHECSEVLDWTVNVSLMLNFTVASYRTHGA